MVEKLLNYEREAFLFLNGLHNDFWDQFMWLFSGQIVWLPLAISLLYVIITKSISWKNAIIIIMAIVLVITLCDRFSSDFCKNYFHRLRPSHHPDFSEYVHNVFGYKGGRYGFISSHAANAFGFITLTTLIFRSKIYLIITYLWGAVTAYSRIYLGVHFLTDIIPGIFVGIFFGWIVYKLYYIAQRKLVGRLPIYKQKDFNIFYITLSLTLFFMLITSILYSNRVVEALVLKSL